ncbi:hypothetical protein RI367_003600 [Sorochytrium milnesiophthora]
MLSLSRRLCLKSAAGLCRSSHGVRHLAGGRFTHSAIDSRSTPATPTKLVLSEKAHGRYERWLQTACAEYSSVLETSTRVYMPGDDADRVRWTWSDQLTAKEQEDYGVADESSATVGDGVGSGVVPTPARWHRRLFTRLVSSKRGRELVQTIQATFLPVGYPESAHPSYLRFHIMKFTETALGSATSVLCAQAMLESVGVAGAAAAGGAVAILWVLKDGIGEVGKLFFIKHFASQFDARVKTWKLAGEVLYVTGSLISLCTVIAPPSMFLPLASIGGGMKSIFISLWGATHTTFARIFAVSGNVGDIVAKDEAQLSVAYMLGASLGVTLLYFNHTPLYLFTCWGILVPLHLTASVNMLQTANFHVLNDVKLSLIARHFVDHGTVADLALLNKTQWMFGEWTRPSASIPRIRPGMSIHQLFSSEHVLEQTMDLLKSEHYLLGMGGRTSPAEKLLLRLSRASGNGVADVEKAINLGISYNAFATSQDIARSLLHATLYNDLVQRLPVPAGDQQKFTALQESYQMCNDRFPTFWQLLQESDWETDAVFFNDRGVRYTREEV